MLLFDQSDWSLIDVRGDVYWDTDVNNKGKLQTLFDEAVTLDGYQRITGSVKFLKDVSTDNIFMNETINNINMSHIISDTVLKNKQGQVCIFFFYF